MRMLAFSKDTNGFYRVFYTDTGHVIDWVETKAQARALIRVQTAKATGVQS